MSGVDQPISYGQWGNDFFRTAVTEERLLGAVKQLAGRPIEFGPMGVGPGRIAQITAVGQVGEPSCQPVDGAEVAFRILIPAQVEFDLDLQLNKQHFSVELVIPIIATAKAMSGLKIYIETIAPGPHDLQVSVRAHGLRASVVSIAAGVEGEFRKFVAKFVARELGKPEISAARTIDVAGRIEGAWKA